MARFFVDRPIVAIVIAIVTVLLGLVSMPSLPIAQYPSIIPPQIQIQTTYTGADAMTIEQSVATPIEQQMNGVEKMLYMQSTNANDGTMTLTVTFDVGERRQHRPGERAEPRLPGRAESPHRREPVRHHLSEHAGPAAHGHVDLLAEGDLRPALPRQLRADQRERRALPRAGRGPGRQLRSRRVLDADLGQARQAGQARASPCPTSCAPSSSRTPSTQRAESARSRRRRARS